MILKICDENNGTIGAIHVYENNENGKVSVQDTHHIKAVEYCLDDVFGTNDDEVIIIVDITEFKENYLIAGEVYHEFEDVNDEDFYHLCMESISNRLEVGVGPIPDRVYEIWSIIEEEYL